MRVVVRVVECCCMLYVGVYVAVYVVVRVAVRVLWCCVFAVCMMKKLNIFETEIECYQCAEHRHSPTIFYSKNRRWRFREKLIFVVVYFCDVVYCCIVV